MDTPEEIRQVLAAGPRPGTRFLATLFLDSVPRLAEEQDIDPHGLQQAREAELAMRIMALANGPSSWGVWRYLVIGARDDGQVSGIPSGVISNDIVQRIVHHYCEPAPSCYYQESRIEGQRAGLIVISDSALKPFHFACDVAYEQAGRRELAYRQGEIWVHKNGEPELATAEEVVELKLGAALVRRPLVSEDILSPVSKSEQQLEWTVLEQTVCLSDERDLLAAIAEAPDVRCQILEWFWSLDYHERYFVLAVCLFGALPSAEFWRLYEKIVAEVWREREPDLRIIPGLEAKLAEHIRDDLSFKHPECRQVILAEAIQRYRRPLIWALAQIRDVVIQIGGSGATSETCTLLGQVIGGLAQLEWDAVLPILQSWATQRSESVRYAAVQALWVAAKSGDDKQREAVLSMLGDWTSNRGLEAGWVAPRHAYRVRRTAALALGRIASSLDPAAFESIVLPHFWTLARDPHPRVRQALALALRFAGPLHFPGMAGLLGYLAADSSKRVRSHVAKTLATMSATHGTAVLDILNAWATESGTPRQWSALLTLLLIGQRDAQACNALVALAAQSAELQSEIEHLLTEVCQATASRLEALLPWLERLADHEERGARNLAVVGLLAMAHSARNRPSVQALIDRWRETGSPRMVETAAQWNTKWVRLREAEPQILEGAEEIAREEVAYGAEEDIEEEAISAMPSPVERRGSVLAAESGQLRPGPRRWLRSATPLASETKTRKEAIFHILRRLATAVAMVILAYLVLDRFPYYDSQWRPVILLAILLASYWRGDVGAVITVGVCLFPLLYHSPVLALAALGFVIIVVSLANVLGGPDHLEKGLVIFGFPLLASTPLGLALPFLIGWLFRRRGVYLVLLGVILSMVVGIVMGQGLMGSYLATGFSASRNMILTREPPAEWQDFGWLLNLETYKIAVADGLEILRLLFKAFTATPFLLMQLALWCLAAWLTGWAVDQSNPGAGILVIAAAAIGVIACYSVLLPDILGWSLPFTPGLTMNVQALAGAVVAILGIYGWPIARRRLKNAPIRAIALKYLQTGRDWFMSRSTN